MKKLVVTFFVCILTFTFSCSLFNTVRSSKNPVVMIKTEFGEIDLELYGKKAPDTVKNFLRYVDAGMYKDAIFHRTVTDSNQPNDKIKINVIQAGRKRGGPDNFPPIEIETTQMTGVLHKDGVISMARSGPNSAISHIFICVGDQPELDFGGKRNPDGYGFAAFGKVIKGMDIVRKIHQSPCEGQRLTPPVKIFDIIRKEK